MVQKANFVFGLFNSYTLTNYQPQYTKLNLLSQIWTLGTKPNLLTPNLLCPNQQNQIYKTKSTKQIVWNVNNQIYQTKSFQ